MPDYVALVPHGGSPPIKVPVLQVWVDPKFPDAHRDKKLRGYLEAMAMPALIRTSARDGFMVAPRNVSRDGRWFEGMSHAMHEQEHTLEDKLAAIGPMRMTLELDK